MRKTKKISTVPFVTTDNLWEDIGFSPAEALELKVRSEIYRELMDHIHERHLKQTELGKLLGIHQPDVSYLMNGRVSKFSAGKLIQFASKLNLGVSVKVTKAKPQSAKLAGRKSSAKKHVVATA